MGMERLLLLPELPAMLLVGEMRGDEGEESASPERRATLRELTGPETWTWKGIASVMGYTRALGMKS
jgi:hypothetical protein